MSDIMIKFNLEENSNIFSTHLKETWLNILITAYFFPMDENCSKNHFENHLLVEMVFHMDEFLFSGEEKWMKLFTLLFLCTPIDNTIQNILYKIKFSFMCTPPLKHK